MPTTRSSEWRWWFALAVAVCPLCWCQINTSDAWWHVALGRALLERWECPDFTAFYFTPVHHPVFDLRWTAAGDALLFLCYRCAGTAGLQALSLTCLAVAFFLFRGLHRRAMNGWIFALFFAVAAATHQLQLPRNAVFSLPLVVLVFWIFAQWQLKQTIRWLWLYPPVLVFWGVLHGSYLLGMALVVLLFIGDGIDRLLRHDRDLWRIAAHGVAILSVSGAINAVGNPVMLTTPTAVVRSVFRLATVPKPQMDNQVKIGQPAQQQGPRTGMASWKKLLNGLIWARSSGQVWSGDFDSPFDRLSYRPVLVAFMLVFIACVRLLLMPRPGTSWILAFVGLALLGLCYLRMTGYAALGGASLLLMSGRLRGSFGWQFGRFSWIGTLFAAIFSLSIYWASAMGSLGSLIGHQAHIPGPGKICTFDDAACDWILQHHASKPVFTTIVTGSYALSRWAPKKQVFIDGFFAPHPSEVWQDYTRARDHAELWRLHEHYGTQLALIEHTRRDWTRLFISSKDWRPAAVGLGCMVYIHRSVSSEEAPEILFSPGEARKLAPIFREGLAYDYYGALVVLCAQNRVDLARQVVSAKPAHFAELRDALLIEDRWVIPLIEGELRAKHD